MSRPTSVGYTTDIRPASLYNCFFTTNPDMADSKAQWQELYSSALLELDLGKLPESIELAEQSIRARLQEMKSWSRDAHEEEWQAIDDALRTLRLLRSGNLAGW